MGAPWCTACECLLYRGLGRDQEPGQMPKLTEGLKTGTEDLGIPDSCVLDLV
jgi:hypothetical protein